MVTFICYIEANFTFGLVDCVCYNEDFVKSRFVKSRFHCTKFSLMGRLLDFLTHGAPLARFARESSAVKQVLFFFFSICFLFRVKIIGQI